MALALPLQPCACTSITAHVGRKNIPDRPDRPNDVLANACLAELLAYPADQSVSGAAVMIGVRGALDLFAPHGLVRVFQEKSKHFKFARSETQFLSMVG